MKLNEKIKNLLVKANSEKGRVKMGIEIVLEKGLVKDAVMACGENSNFTNVLHVEGENQRLYIYQSFGDGISADVYHGRTLEFDLPDGAIPERVIDFIEENEDEFQALLDGYSEKWNGNNVIGSWDDGAWDDHTPDMHPLQHKLNEESEMDFSINIAYMYYYPSDFVPDAWGGYNDNFVNGYPLPADGDFKKLAEEILGDNDEQLLYCDFDADDLAEYLEEEKDEIWGDLKHDIADEKGI